MGQIGRMGQMGAAGTEDGQASSTSALRGGPVRELGLNGALDVLRETSWLGPGEGRKAAQRAWGTRSRADVGLNLARIAH